MLIGGGIGYYFLYNPKADTLSFVFGTIPAFSLGLALSLVPKYSKVLIDGQYTELFDINMKVRQGDILSPLSLVYGETSRDSSFVGVNSPEQIIIHKGESLEIPITLQNTEQYTQTFSLSLESIGANLTTIGLPIEYTLDTQKNRKSDFHDFQDTRQL